MNRTAAATILLAALCGEPANAAETVRLQCLQDDKQICDPDAGCKAYTARSSVWNIDIDLRAKTAAAELLMNGAWMDAMTMTAYVGPGGEITLWYAPANETFSISAGRTKYARSMATAQDASTVAFVEFGKCSQRPPENATIEDLFR